MPTTRSNAKVELFTLARAALNAAGIADAAIFWPNKEKQTPESHATTKWAVVDLQHFASDVTSLPDPNGNRRYTSEGALGLMVRTRSEIGDDDEATIDTILSNLRGQRTAGGVIIRDIIPQEVGNEGTWFRTDVIASFEYDTFE